MRGDSDEAQVVVFTSFFLLFTSAPSFSVIFSRTVNLEPKLFHSVQPVNSLEGAVRRRYPLNINTPLKF